MTSSSITDKPIESRESDRLRSERYAHALSDFIASSDTPMTVGLQGEWGTGKTSMMYLIREKMQQMAIATSWVNTWEYSMFKGAAETTPAVLEGMLQELQSNCEKEGQWTLKKDGQETLKKIGGFFSKVGNQIVTNQTGLDLMAAANTNEATRQLTIADIKRDIQSVIENLIADPKNKYERVVFFVDDLDRIPPGDAVEVLEALKNMFDIHNCVFVLAIDYDVVVKGLEGKFGKKTEENDREFRSFFDKIIQVPFSMPTGAYTIEDLMKDRLSVMGINIPEEDTHAYAQVVHYTTGSNPRSLKRYLNSFSLLRRLRDAEFDANPEEFEGGAPNSNDDLTLFALLGLQVSYPKVFRFLLESSHYVEWDESFAEKLSVDLKEVAETVSRFGDGMKGKTDEIWEQTIYGFCNRTLESGKRDPYLQTKWEAIVDLLNLLRDKFSKTEKIEDIESLNQLLDRSLSFASITNVDDDVATKQATQTNVRAALEGGLDQWCEGKRYDSSKKALLEKYINALKDAVSHLEEKYAKTQISFKNTEKNSNILYINSLGKDDIRCGCAQQLNKKSDMENLISALPQEYKAQLKSRPAKDEMEYYLASFSVPFKDVEDGNFSKVVQFLESYKQLFQ